MPSASATSTGSQRPCNVLWYLHVVWEFYFFGFKCVCNSPIPIGRSTTGRCLLCLGLLARGVLEQARLLQHSLELATLVHCC